MSKINSTSVRKQLLAAFFVVIAFLIVVSGVSVSKLVQIEHVIGDTSNILYGQHSKTKAIEKALTACDDLTFNLQDDPSRYQGEGASNLQSTMKALEDAVQDTDSVKIDADVIASIKQSASTYLSQGRDFAAALEAGDKDKAVDLYANGLSDTYDVIRKSIGRINDHQIEQATANVKGLNAKADIILVIVLTLVAAVLAVIIASYYSGRINTVLDSVISCVKRFGSGDLSQSVRITSKTEFGQLQRDLEKMRLDLVEIISLVMENAGKISGSVSSIHELVTRMSEESKDSENRALTVAAASDEMVSTTNDIAKNCSVAADDASKSSGTTKEVIKSIEHTIEVIQKQAEKSKDDAASVAR
ncbi:MAG: MCP four helix bundle domain-containing protein, partial [Succinivibrio sp.]